MTGETRRRQEKQGDPREKVESAKRAKMWGGESGSRSMFNQAILERMQEIETKMEEQTERIVSLEEEVTTLCWRNDLNWSALRRRGLAPVQAIIFHLLFQRSHSWCSDLQFLRPCLARFRKLMGVQSLLSSGSKTTWR